MLFFWQKDPNEGIPMITYSCKKCKRVKEVNADSYFKGNCDICGEKMEIVSRWTRSTSNNIPSHLKTTYKQSESKYKQACANRNNSNTNTPSINTSAYNKPTTVTCPYCGSTDTKKITAVGRMASFSVFGIFSGKLGKQWHCNKCKSDF